jgi:glycogen debranching enzyme
MSSRSEGFTPLGYHAGSVWPHDSAIVLHGLSRSGRTTEAAALVDALLSAGAGFDGRLPELFSGDSRAEVPAPVPYPAACRPQAWAAASSVAILSAVFGLRADAVTGTVVVDPLRPSPVGALEVSGLRFGGHDLALALDADGALRSAVAPAGVVVRELVGTGHRSSEASDTLSR